MSLQDITSRLFMLPEFYFGIVSIKETIYREHILYTIKDYTKHLLYNILNYRKQICTYLCVQILLCIFVLKEQRNLKDLFILCTQQQ